MFVRNKIYVGQRTGTCRFDTQIKTETAANDLTRGKTESGLRKWERSLFIHGRKWIDSERGIKRLADFDHKHRPFHIHVFFQATVADRLILLVQVCAFVCLVFPVWLRNFIDLPLEKMRHFPFPSHAGTSDIDNGAHIDTGIMNEAQTLSNMEMSWPMHLTQTMWSNLNPLTHDA